MDLRLISGIAIGKLTAWALKAKGGGATAAPGLYALKIDTDLVKKLCANLKYGSIVVSGTNGKTTTSRLITQILAAKYKTIHNRQGSNLLRGIASTLLKKSSIFGNLDVDLAIWEVDEATLPQALENVNPKMVVLLNLFRDQLDRYGEVDTVRTKWQKALAMQPKDTTLIANADDPGIAFLAKNFKGKVIYFGVEEKNINLPQISQVADVRNCPNCSTKLNYSLILSAHEGYYTCPNCNFKRPKPQVSSSNIKFNKDFSTNTRLTINDKLLTISYQLPGLYNVYNVLAALSASSALNIGVNSAAKELESFSSAFGRFQKIKVGDKNVMIFLIKNPAGANEVLRTIANQKEINLLSILNDNFADGRDVSWIWDTNWEILKNNIKSVTVSGLRAWDLAARFKYAQFKLSKNNIVEDISYSLNFSLGKLKENDTLFILPTYTALLEVQKTLSKLTKGVKWHNQ